MRVRLPSRRELVSRLEQAEAELAHCRLCELACGADRCRGERGRCGLGRDSFCFGRFSSLAEEPALLPAYMVYLGGCNLRCRFCIRAPLCLEPDAGCRVRPGALAGVLARRVRAGARTIIWVGGEPALHPHTILATALHAPGPLPFVLKTNLYVRPELIEWTAGVIQLYLVDFKFGNDICARAIAGLDRYGAVLRRNLRLAAGAGPVVVRHLLLPGHLDCCLRPIAEWLAEHLPGVGFHLMTGYVPAWRARQDPALGRTLERREVDAAECFLDGLGLGSIDDVLLPSESAPAALQA